MVERFINGTDGVMVSMAAMFSGTKNVPFLADCPKLADYIWELLKNQPKGEEIEEGLSVDGTTNVFYSKREDNLIITVLVFWNNFEEKPGWAILSCGIAEPRKGIYEYKIHPVDVFIE